MGTEGNELADDYANRGFYLEHVAPLKITFADALCEIKDQMINTWQEEYDRGSLSKGNKHYKVQGKVSTKSWFHGNAIKILTRLRTNHGLCGITRHLFKLEITPNCTVCNRTNDLEHILLRCKKYRNCRGNFEFSKNHQVLTDLMQHIDIDTYREIVQFYVDADLDF